MGTSQQKKGFWQISTGTVLGAVVIAIISSLLGPNAPWFVERLSAGGREPVTFTVNSVFSRKTDTLDQNRWHVDQDLGFALVKPPQEWLINKTNPSTPLAGPSIASVPFLHLSMGQASSLENAGKIQRDDIVTTELRPPGSLHKLEFGDDSTIDEIPMRFNPATSEAFLKRSIAARLRVQQALSEELPANVLDILEQRTPEGREAFAKVRTKLEDDFEKAIKSNWPAPLDYVDNVTVTTFRTSLFRGDPIYEAVLRSRGLSLLTTFGLISVANPELLTVNTKAVSISTNNLALLMDTSVEIGKFKIDGRQRDLAELRRFVLVVLAVDKVHVVVWRNFVGLGGSAEETDRMRDVFQSFRLLETRKGGK